MAKIKRWGQIAGNTAKQLRQLPCFSPAQVMVVVMLVLLMAGLYLWRSQTVWPG